MSPSSGPMQLYPSLPSSIPVLCPSRKEGRSVSPITCWAASSPRGRSSKRDCFKPIIHKDKCPNLGVNLDRKSGRKRMQKMSEKKEVENPSFLSHFVFPISGRKCPFVRACRHLRGLERSVDFREKACTPPFARFPNAIESGPKKCIFE